MPGVGREGKNSLGDEKEVVHINRDGEFAL